MKQIRIALAVLVAATTAPLLLPAPAAAAPLGTVKLSQSSGTVDATPIFGTATASKPCPSGYGSDALVRIGPPGGPYSNVAKPLMSGGYDRKAVTVRPNRSFATALAGAPTDGEWWVVVECFSQDLGQHADRFVTPVTVTGRTWKVGQPASGAADLDSPPPPRPAVPTAGATASPTGAPATTPAPTVAGTPGPTPLLASNDRTGSGSPLASVAWVAGVVAVLAVVGGIMLLTRRRRSG
ncbi:hypothetical protein [Phytohabitans rumicis]|uniref:Gram-positive cocci surface proteins LPxTG domain-containing protein n=1 Tax=Phytohabitans rumicis TaxID=1076125 RepID=A0A6V8KMX4_9ACTN|nr:hypothetical protein [Phytohabitans rumicis]GFJ86522.1 hypothetical protein Prum_001640 [Phytohabitans rumicis]